MTESSRSRSYPAISLSEATEVLGKQVGGLGWGAHDRNAIAQALGYTSGTSGVAARKIAALAQYGLLQKQRGLYEPTSLARILLEEEDEDRLKTALRTAFLHTPLFREIIQGHLQAGYVPRLLAHALCGFRIVSNARDEVARIFMESAQHARVMDANGIFETDFLTSIGQPIPIAKAPTGSDEPEESGTGAVIVPPVSASSEQILRLYLTDGKLAELRLPLRLNDQDLTILQMQLRVLETQVQVNKPAPPLRWLPRQERGSG